MKINYFLLSAFVLLLIASCSDFDLERNGKSISSEDSLSFSATSSSSGSSASDSSGGIDIEPGQITSAEWHDQANWDFWLNLTQDEEYAGYLSSWEMNPVERFSILLTDMQAQPCIDCKVELLDRDGIMIWSAKSDNYGKAELWANFFNASSYGTYAVNIDCEGYSNTFPLMNSGDEINHFSIPVYSQNPFEIDVSFVFDATGSMGDELEYLKVEILDVLQLVNISNPNDFFRYSSVFYRDEGDEYVTKFSDFSPNANTLSNFINDQSAAGGGDYPEAVHEALKTAIEELNWSPGAKARLMFLLLDAPPHEAQTVKEQLKSQIAYAAEKGIKIIPIAASGVNKSTEFFLRGMALATNGTYTFVTDHSGIGNDHLEPTTGEYEIEYLNNMVVRLINHYSK